MNGLFGNGRNVVKETAEVFRENAESGAARGHALQVNAMAQFAGEFRQTRRGMFDRVMDGINRLPRPMMALGCLGLLAAAMYDPIWFAARMQGIALVPEPLWWLLGVVVSFYFGARHQAKGQQFQQSMASTMATAPEVMKNIEDLQAMRAKTAAEAGRGFVESEANPALEAWRSEAQK